MYECCDPWEISEDNPLDLSQDNFGDFWKGYYKLKVILNNGQVIYVTKK